MPDVVSDPDEEENEMAEMPEVGEFIQAHIERQDAAIEEAVEAALQDGRYGVLVVRRWDESMTVSVSPLVPYGQIHEHYV